MKAKDARGLALHALLDTVYKGRHLDDALRDTDVALREPRDRALARALAYGVCRHWHQLEAIREQLLDKPLRRRDRVLGLIIVLGLYQLLLLRVPEHAAVNESVELARREQLRWATKLVNAVLRKAARQWQPFNPQRLAAASARLSHPEWLLSQWRRDWPTRWRDIALAGNQQPPMVLRVNAMNVSPASYRERLAQAGIDAHGFGDAWQPWLSDALVLTRAMDVSALPGFDDGDVSVQDAAAQLAAPLLGAREGERVLDACAAPGGKTTHIATLAPNLEQLVAVEPVPARATRLRHSLERARVRQRVEYLDADARELASHFRHGYFHRILLDAPCSGTGVIRRHPDIKLHRCPAQIERAAQLQLELLQALWPLLARGGTLLYATCSVMPAENRDVVSTFLARSRDACYQAIALPAGTACDVGHQILPGDDGMDGFYYARLGKT